MRNTPLVLLAVLLSGCNYLPFGFTEIAEIRANPTAFEGREVKIRGEVIDIARIPFIETRIYTLHDGTDEVAVFAVGELPPVGENVAARGTVESVAIIAGQSFGVRIRESKRLPRYLAGSRSRRAKTERKD